MKATKPKKLKPEEADAAVQLYANGACHCSVCVRVELTAIEVAAAVNKLNPSGVGPWKICDEKFADGSPNPVACNADPEHRRHWLLTC